MRNVRYLPPEERVFALNRTAEVVGGPIGNSPFNLGGNVAGRGAHTGGSIPWKTLEGIKYREAYDLPTTPRSQSMHPMGTDAAKDPRGLVVPQVETGADFVQRAKDSMKIQFNDTVTGRYSDLPRRVIVENMLQGAQRRRGDFSTGSGLLYGVDASPPDVKAAKAFLQLPENEQLRINMLKGSFTPDSPQGKKFLANPKNAALADMYISQLYRANLPIPVPSMKDLKQNASGIGLGVAMSALNPEVAQAVEQNNLGQAGLILGKDAALGMTGEAGLKAGLGVASKYIPAVAKAAPTLAKIGGVVGPAGTGAALFAQGQSGSLTDVLTRKAAQNPVSFMPSVQANPETDIGARASRAIVNEAKYFIINPLQKAFKNVFGNREI
jgi:hypothetical protein